MIPVSGNSEISRAKYDSVGVAIAARSGRGG
jgi:hypothetical protein